MLINKIGDILNAEENIICHQVNVDGCMGGGLAKQIASSYPQVKNGYCLICKQYDFNYDLLKERYWGARINYTHYIANCFTQKSNFETDYDAIKKVFKNLLEECKKENITIAVPYKYGCGIANGNWEIVRLILEELSDKYGVNISVYRLEEK